MTRYRFVFYVFGFVHNVIITIAYVMTYNDLCSTDDQFGPSHNGLVMFDCIISLLQSNIWPEFRLLFVNINMVAIVDYSWISDTNTRE